MCKAAANQGVAAGQQRLGSSRVGRLPVTDRGVEVSAPVGGVVSDYGVAGVSMPPVAVIRVFRDLATVRVIEPISKVDALRVPTETGVDSVAYWTPNQLLPILLNLNSESNF